MRGESFTAWSATRRASSSSILATAALCTAACRPNAYGRDLGRVDVRSAPAIAGHDRAASSCWLEPSLLDQRIDALVDLFELVRSDVLPDKCDDRLRRGYRVLEQLPQCHCLAGC